MGSGQWAVSACPGERGLAPEATSTLVDSPAGMEGTGQGGTSAGCRVEDKAQGLWEDRALGPWEDRALGPGEEAGRGLCIVAAVDRTFFQS